MRISSRVNSFIGILLFALSIYAQEMSFDDFYSGYISAVKSGEEEEFILKNGNIKGDYVNLELLAFYEIGTDFTDYMKGSSSEESYGEMRNALKKESSGGGGKGLFTTMALLLSRNYDGCKSALQGMPPSREKDYLNLLCLLFASDFENYANSLSSYLSKYRFGEERYRLVRYAIMSSYVQDGELFLQHFKGDWQKVRLLSSIAAKETPLMYEALCGMSLDESADSLKKILEKNEAYHAEVLLTDFERGIAKKDEIRNFIKLHPSHPLNPLLSELSK